MNMSTVKPRTLRSILIRRLVGAILMMAICLNIVFGIISHKQLHDHIDAMLIEIATMEAKLNMAEPGPIHVHSSPFMLAGTDDLMVRKSIVYDEQCNIIAASWETSTKTMPTPWCTHGQPHTSRVDFLKLDKQELRAASTAVFLDEHGKRYSFVAGIDHTMIDVAILKLILTGSIPSLIFVVLLWLLITRIATALTRDLETLTQSCQRLEPIQPGTWNVSTQEFELYLQSTQEIQILSSTITQLKKKLHQSMQTQSRFMAEAAHELRTPLTAIRGEIEVTLRRTRTTEEYQESFNLALEDLQRMQQLTEKLLAAVKTGYDEKLVLRKTSIAKLVEETLSQMHLEIIRSKLDVQLNIDNTLPWVLADSDASKRVLQNIITNTLIHAHATTLYIKVTHNTQMLELFIGDDGQGIKQELLQDLFGPFARGSQTGHGLGLYIAQRLMRAQHGDLDVFPSEDGVCWRITFMLNPPSTSY